ncbi:MAG: autotransporter outer membrane beta-barrel domain-containing protein, partial [Phascolarctobacterium sp.]|nr:autotransporter outer membrane beta-barrel domain-containing protein [Phascolarctobacterium sp.]
TTINYTNNDKAPEVIYGGNITIGNAEADSQVHLVTDGSNVNRQDAEQIRTTLENLADKITYEANDGNLSGSVTLAEGLTTSSASLMFADLGFDANGQGDVSGEITITDKETAPDVVYGDSETAMMSGAKSAMASTAMMWRSESNDLLKRMGDLRENKAERGIWAKYYGGKYEMDGDKTGFNTSYNAYQVGYDKQVGNGWNVGVAMSYSDGDSTYTRGKGETSVMSLGLYGTWNGDDGQYVDLIVKRSKLDNEFEVSNIYGKKLDGDYEAWGTSISAEYGKRFELKNGMYVDPNVELTLGRVEGESYNAQSTYLDALGKNKSLHVQQDDFNSLVGRLGVRFGHNTENNSIHAKVALAHEFCGDFDSRFSAEGEVPGSTSVDFGDTWYEIQLGGSTKLSDNSLLYATFERSFGGDVEQKWRIDAGLRWSF